MRQEKPYESKRPKFATILCLVITFLWLHLIYNSTIHHAFKTSAQNDFFRATNQKSLAAQAAPPIQDPLPSFGPLPTATPSPKDPDPYKNVTFCPFLGDPDSKICPAGCFYPSKVGACVPCPQRTICKPGTMEQPLICPAGQYCPDPAIEADCPVGFYCPLGSTEPIGCNVPGMYCQTGSAQPAACNYGYYCPNSSVSFDCPRNYYCRDAVTAPTSCSIFSYCPARSYADIYNFFYVIVSFLAICAIAVSTYRSGRNLRSNQRINMNNSLQSTPSPRSLNQAGQTGQSEIPSEESFEKATVVLSLPRAPSSSRDELISKIVSPQIKPTEYVLQDVSLTLANGVQILRSVSFTIQPGSLVALMGSSGCGKSTLLSLLAGKKPPTGAALEGTLLLNGRKFPPHPPLFCRWGAYLEQDDILFSELTPRETLEYAAQLRLDPSIPAKQRTEMVDAVLKLLKLWKSSSTPVGFEGKKGISGGEKRRLSLALELIAQPSLLLLDEPVSGLDSSTSLEVVRILRSLASLGITIVVVIHAPRYSLFQLFDDVIMLGLHGSVVYHGPTGDMLPYFRSIGFPPDIHCNPADFVIDCISGNIPHRTPTGQTQMLSDVSGFLSLMWKNNQDSFEPVFDLTSVGNSPGSPLPRPLRRPNRKRWSASRSRSHNSSCDTTTDELDASPPHNTSSDDETLCDSEIEIVSSVSPSTSASASATNERPKANSTQPHFNQTSSMLSPSRKSAPIPPIGQSASQFGLQSDPGSPLEPILKAGRFYPPPSLKRSTSIQSARQITASRTEADEESLDHITADSSSCSPSSPCDELNSLPASPVDQSTSMDSLQTEVQIVVEPNKVESTAQPQACKLQPKAKSSPKVRMQRGPPLLKVAAAIRCRLNRRSGETTFSLSPSPTFVSSSQPLDKLQPASFSASAAPNQTTATVDDFISPNGQSKKLCFKSICLHQEEARETKKLHPRPSPIRQFCSFFKRAGLQTLRTRRSLVMDIVLSICCGLVVGGAFMNCEIANLVFAGAVAMLSLALISIQSSIRIFNRERIMWLREKRAGCSALAYFIGKDLSFLPVALLTSTIFTSMFYSLYAPQSPYYEYLYLSALVIWSTSSIGYMIALTCSTSNAQLVGVTIPMLALIISGASPTLSKFSDIGAEAAVIPMLSYARWAQEIFAVIELRQYPSMWDQLTGNISKALLYYSYSFNNINHCVKALLYYGLVGRALAFFILNCTKKAPHK